MGPTATTTAASTTIKTLTITTTVTTVPLASPTVLYQTATTTTAATVVIKILFNLIVAVVRTTFMLTGVVRLEGQMGGTARLIARHVVRQVESEEGSGQWVEALGRCPGPGRG